MKKIIAALVASLIASNIDHAYAATYDFEFSGHGYEDPSYFIAATGYVITSDVVNSYGGYDILDIIGTVGGNKITGLDPASYLTPSSPPLYSDGNFFYDNTIYNNISSGLSHYSLSNEGIGFIASGVDYHMGSDTGIKGLDSFLFSTKSTSSLPIYSNFEGNVSLTKTPSAVPEPASWLLMMLGFGLVGSMLRRSVPVGRTFLRSLNACQEPDPKSVGRYSGL